MAEHVDGMGWMCRLRRLSAPLSLMVLLLTWASVARADEAADAFNDGKRLMGKAQHKEACDAFKRSEDAAGPNVKTRYWTGRCNEEQGKKAAAFLAYKDAKRMAEKAGDTSRVSVIDKRIEELGKVLPFLVLTVPKEIRVKGLTIRRDGDLIPESEWGEPTPVDVGKHQITVSAPGMQEITLNVTATEPGSKAQLVVPALTKKEGAAPPPRPTPKPGATVPAPKPEPGKGEPATTRRSSGAFWTGVALVSAGGLAAIAGSLLLVQGDGGDGTGRVPAGAGLLVASGAFLGVGIPFMVVFGKQVPVEAEGTTPKEARATLTVQPLITPGGFALIGTF